MNSAVDAYCHSVRGPARIVTPSCYQTRLYDEGPALICYNTECTSPYAEQPMDMYGTALTRGQHRQRDINTLRERWERCPTKQAVCNADQAGMEYDLVMRL